MISRISVTTNPRICQGTDSQFSSTLSSSALKSNQEISCIFLLLPHQLDMKTTVMLARIFVVFFDTIDLLGPIVYVIFRDT